MLLSQHKDLKREIISLPEKDKDKLLLRLIAKDKVLTEHLHFKLLENEDDLLSRHENLVELIDQQVKEMLDGRRCTSRDVLLKMRTLNGAINHHAKVTKDVGSEIELRFYLLNKIPVDFDDGIFRVVYVYNEKLYLYYVKATVSVWKKYNKLHEDIQFDLKESFNTILEKIYTNSTASIARALGLPKEL
ncbi:hypothetical protein [Pedobacter metabolipauper]|uniref:Uncharacterized protein n=1 Tax=Pedobacter metabolipauper TaxID=425513 RepID=A0A4R6T020_9SPHI|nr:hypothetical protein [Pedobacter metabolipauper]TDQ10372.1 hypothetical protein ATK78_2538 [Pedobacter metabolipauper]